MHWTLRYIIIVGVCSLLPLFVVIKARYFTSHETEETEGINNRKIESVSNIPGTISALEVEKYLKKYPDLQIIDVREDSEFKEGHIAGAKLIPLANLEERISEIDTSKEIILVCKSGNRSAKAQEVLRKLGLENTLNMLGGMKAWTGIIKKDISN